MDTVIMVFKEFFTVDKATLLLLIGTTLFFSVLGSFIGWIRFLCTDDSDSFKYSLCYNAIGGVLATMSAKLVVVLGMHYSWEDGFCLFIIVCLTLIVFIGVNVESIIDQKNSKWF